MTDPYLLLTPLLVLAILGLIRFIGCNQIFGLDDPVVLALDPPEAVTAVPGDQRVEVTWVYTSAVAESFTVVYGTVMGGPYPGSVTVMPDPGVQHGATVDALVNGTPHFFKVTGETGDDSTVIPDSVEVSATPGVTSFVDAATLGPERNNFQGWVGMAITIGADDVVATQLGRIVGPANTRAHVVRIVEAGPGGVDMASVTVNMPAGPVGEFAYVSLPTPVTLLALRQYLVLSHEETGGDLWHDLPTLVTTTDVASVTSGVFNDDAAPGFFFQGGAGQTYVPVSFRY